MLKTLLPTGCYDLLPPFARQESQLSSNLLSVFESYGYEQVSPPLLEYSDNLLAGRGAELSPQIFRVMDAAAGKVMGIRADITLQIARIAMSRLAEAPRPLRLCYNGLILRMQGEYLKGDRQLQQAGIELIGASSPEADAEVILVAAEALSRAGIKDISIDLNLPGIVSALLASERLESETLEKLMAAVTHKDIAAIKSLSFAYRDTLIGLLQCAGPAAAAMAAIQRLDLPESAARQCRDLEEVIRILKTSGKHLTLTIDAAESRGFAYHSGISFSMFVPGVVSEIGRGGRYLIGGVRPEFDTEATGFTVYVETLRGLLPTPTPQKRVFVTEGIGADVTALQQQGYVVVYALSEYGKSQAEAKRLGYSYIFKDGKVKPL
jgi:ATP phosphoribosyltransferase regulatory subunit